MVLPTEYMSSRLSMLTCSSTGVRYGTLSLAGARLTSVGIRHEFARRHVVVVVGTHSRHLVEADLVTVVSLAEAKLVTVVSLSIAETLNTRDNRKWPEPAGDERQKMGSSAGSMNRQSMLCKIKLLVPSN